MDTFTPPKAPNIESSGVFTANVLQAQFGDGYEQTASPGLNSVSVTYAASWDLLSSTDLSSLEAFFAARYGSQAFLYTLPGELTARKFKCKTWTRGYTGALFTLRAELREVFDLT